MALKPYYGYSHSIITSEVGAAHFSTQRENGFARAFKQKWCRNADFVYEYFGDHNDKVHRTGHREYICGDIGCTAGESSWTPWTSYDWAGFGSRGIPGP